MVRRGVSAAQEHFSGAQLEYIQRLQHDSELYEKAGPEMEVVPRELLPILVTAFITLFVIASVSRPLRAIALFSLTCDHADSIHPRRCHGIFDHD